MLVGVISLLVKKSMEGMAVGSREGTSSAAGTGVGYTRASRESSEREILDGTWSVLLCGLFSCCLVTSALISFNCLLCGSLSMWVSLVGSGEMVLGEIGEDGP